MANLKSFYKILFYHLVCVHLFLDEVTGALTQADQEIIDKVNSMGKGWTAGVNNVLFPKERMKLRKEKKRTVPTKPAAKYPLPECFDLREKWGTCCGSILNLRPYQGSCDSSWAMSVASMLSDRSCIESQGKIKRNMSTVELMTCCKKCRPENQHPCKGGDPIEALFYFTREGIVSGGYTKTKTEGCKPYGDNFLHWKDGDTDEDDEEYEDMPDKQTSQTSDGGIICEKKCTNEHYKKDYYNRIKGDSLYIVPPNEKSIRQEIFNYGPVTARIKCAREMEFYRKGIYKSVIPGANRDSIMYVKLIGWGKAPDKEESATGLYWIAVTMYGPDYGELRGIIHVERGSNADGIEDFVLAGRSFFKITKSSPRAGISGGTKEAVPVFCVNWISAKVIVVYFFFHMSM